MVLRRLGFCGIDDKVNIQDIINLSKQCSIIEWGVLFHPKLVGTPRYASHPWIQNLINKIQENQIQVNLAAHICGEYVYHLINGNFNLIEKIINKYNFNRIQINPTLANGVQIKDYNYTAQKLLLVFKNFKNTEFIMQRNTETEELCQIIEKSKLSNISFLFDNSCGLGIYNSNDIIPYNITNKYGFAGGINPENIGEILDIIKSSIKSKDIWIDMETGIRTNNSFDINKCTECVKIYFSK